MYSRMHTNAATFEFPAGKTLPFRNITKTSCAKF